MFFHMNTENKKIKKKPISLHKNELNEKWF